AQAVWAGDRCTGALGPGTQLVLTGDAVAAGLGKAAGDDDQGADALLLALLEEGGDQAPGDADDNEIDVERDVEDGRVGRGVVDVGVARIYGCDLAGEAVELQIAQDS